MKKLLVTLLWALCFLPLASHAETVPHYPDTESSFILPLVAGNGEDLTLVHQQVRDDLAAWGQFVMRPVQYTQTQTNGVVQIIDSIEYTAVVHCDADGQKKFRDVVRNAKNGAHLEHIYLKQCSGHVMLLK